MDLAFIQGTLIAANIGDHVIEHREDQHNSSFFHHSSTAKRHANLLNLNVHHILRVAHVMNLSSLPSLYTVLARYPKAQHLVTLQGALDGAKASLASRVDTVATLVLMKRLLSLQICMEDREHLTTELQPFMIR